MATDRLKVILVEQKGINRKKLKEYDAMGECQEPECDDVLKIYIKSDRQIVTDIGFTITESACAPAVACASIATQLAKGKAVMAAYTITKEQIMTPLSTEDGMLDKEHIHCAIMAEIALKRAVVNFSENLKAQFRNNK